MIKIPGTPAGLPAIEQAIYEGINVNVTLLFSVEAYTTDEVTDKLLRDGIGAFVTPMEKLLAGLEAERDRVVNRV